MRELAGRVLEHETRGRGGPEGLAEADGRICQKLYTRTELLVGPSGARAILGHALRKTEAEFAFLRAVQVGDDQGECLKGLRESLQGHEADVANRGLVALLAGILGLLRGLLGRDLVLGTIKGCWPEMPACDECDFQEWEVRE